MWRADWITGVLEGSNESLGMKMKRKDKVPVMRDTKQSGGRFTAW
jgi:hypothetical protein